MKISAILIMALMSHAIHAESVFMVPGKSWGFQFNSPMLIQQRGDATDTEYQFEAGTEIGFIITGFVEPAQGKGNTSEACMKFYWSQASRNPSILQDTVKVIAESPFTVVTYLIDAEYQGTRYIQPNANYYGHKEDKCIDFHVSQTFLYDTEIDYSNLLEFARTFGYYE